MKKAILAVSFGTSYADAERDCIRPIENAIRAAYPDHEVRRAFTSRIIMRKLRGQRQCVESESEALARLAGEGYDEIAVVPTHIIPGEEYGRVCAAAEGRRVSAPLLADEQDLEWMAGLLGEIAAQENRTLVVMGHGSEHAANETYLMLRKKLPRSVFLACVAGECALEGIIPELEALPEKSVTLMPLMIVAGDHAHNDLAGEDDDSWRSILEKRGFDVRVRMQGLGALTAVQQRFVRKAGEILS